MKSNSKAHNQTLRIAAYCRTAGVDPGEDRLAIAAQLAAAESWCRDNLADQRFEIEAFIDAGFSGTLGWEPSGGGQGYRPALGRLVERIKDQRVSVVIASSLDRLGRSARVVAEFFALRDSAGAVRLVSLADGPDTAVSAVLPAPDTVRGRARFLVLPTTGQAPV